MGSKQWTPLNAIDDLNIDSDNDTYEFIWPFPVHVYRAAFLATTAVANAAGTVDVEVYKVTDASDGGTDTLLGTWQVLATTTLAVGDWSIGNFVGADTDGSTAVDNSTVYEGPDGPYEIGVGEGLLFKVVEPSDSGAGRLCVEFIPQPVHSDEASGNVARVYNVPAV